MTYSVLKVPLNPNQPTNQPTDRDAVWVKDSDGPRFQIPMGRGNFEGEEAAHCNV